MKNLNEFLDEGAPAPEPEFAAVVEPAAEPIVEPVVVEKPTEEEPQSGARVPVAALQAERQQRQDWKEKAVRAEAELSALRPQLDEMQEIRARLAEIQKAQATPAAPAAPPPAPEVVPNPAEDPQGFIAYQSRQQQQAILNERLNLSEAMLRDTIGDNADVDAKVAIFKKAVAANPALQAELFRQPHPFKWAYDQAKRITAMEQVGADPEAFVQKRIAEARAEWEAAAAATPRAPEVVLPQSLAGARNAGTRTQAEETVPEFEDIFKRKAR